MFGLALSSQTWWDTKTKLIFKAIINNRSVWKHLIAWETLLTVQIVSRLPPILKWPQAITLYHMDMSSNKTFSLTLEVCKYLMEAHNPNLISTIPNPQATSSPYYRLHQLQATSILSNCSNRLSISNSFSIQGPFRPHKSLRNLSSLTTTTKCIIQIRPSHKMASVKIIPLPFRRNWLRSKIIRALGTVQTMSWAPLTKARKGRRWPRGSWVRMSTRPLSRQPKSPKWLGASLAHRNLCWVKTRLAQTVLVDKWAKTSVNGEAITSPEW